MLTALTEEGLVPVSRIGELAPEVDGKPIDGETGRRWATRGFKGVRLETVRVAGRRCTSRAAVTRFLQKVAEVCAKHDGGR